MSERFAQVALPLPLASSYTYRIPETLGDRVVAGARVVVPVRRRELIGIVVEADSAPPEAAARDVLAAPDDETAIPAGLLETAHWVAGYYGAPLGLTLKAMLPGGMWGESTVVATLVRGAAVPGGLAGEVTDWLEGRGGEAPVSTAARALKRPLWDVLDRLARVGAVVLRVEPPDTEGAMLTERVASLAADPPTLLERDGLFRRAPKQRRLYEALEQLGGSALVRHVIGQLGFTPAVLRALEQRGLVRIGEAERVRDPFADFPAVPPPSTLTADQQAALAAVQAVDPGDGAVLFGVTGSGKTLVYLEAVRRVLAAGRGAIVLVPEIGLTPQTVSRFRGAFGDQVAVLHSSPVGRRARRCLAAAAPGRAAGRGRREIRHLRARAGPRHDRARRGARGQLQERRDAALPRPGGRRRSRPDRGRQPHSRERHAVAGHDGAGESPAPAAPPPGAHRRAAAAAGGAGGPARRAQGERDRRHRPGRRRSTRPSWPRSRAGSRPCSCSTGAASRRSCSAPTAARCGSARAAASRSRCTRRRPGLRCHYCGHEEPVPFTCRKCANPVQQMRGLRHPAARAAPVRALSRRRAWRAWTSTPRAPSGRTSGSSPRSRRARWTCCSARR